jgi:transposase-like protein
MSVLSKPYFHDEEWAFAHLESVLWPEGLLCLHCGGVDRISKVKANPAKRVRFGLHNCGDCGKQFTVKVGTAFEHSRNSAAQVLAGGASALLFKEARVSSPAAPYS